MSDYLRRIYDLERQLPERNFAKDHSYEEWLVREREPGCGYREPVGDVPDMKQLARTAAAKIYPECISRTCFKKMNYPECVGCADQIAFQKRAAAIIEEVLAGSNQNSGDEATGNER